MIYYEYHIHVCPRCHSRPVYAVHSWPPSVQAADGGSLCEEESIWPERSICSVRDGRAERAALTAVQRFSVGGVWIGNPECPPLYSLPSIFSVSVPGSPVFQAGNAYSCSDLMCVVKIPTYSVHGCSALMLDVAAAGSTVSARPWYECSRCARPRSGHCWMSHPEVWLKVIFLSARHR